MTIPTQRTTPADLRGIVYDLPDTDYHNRPELSSTGARAILDSPARFHYQRQNGTPGRRAFDVGHAVHAEVLGAGAPLIAYPDEHLTPSGAPSSKAASVAWVDEQRAAGLTPVAAADLIRVRAMTAAVLAHPAARHYLEQPGAPEASVFATDPDTGVDVRARFDYLPEDWTANPTAVDLKTTAGSASSLGFGRDAARHGYPVQEAHYLDALEWVTGQRLPMVFVVVEKTPPHLVAVHRFDDVTRIVGADLAARARTTYAECIASGDWPAYGDGVLTTQAPGWWLDRLDGDDDIDIA